MGSTACRSRRRLLPLLILALLLPAGLGAQPAPVQRTLPELQNLFRRSCAGCHGPDGSGHSATGRRLTGRDFTSPRAMRGRSDQALEATIRHGLRGGLRMPAFRSELSPEEIRTLVREVVRKAEKGKAIGTQP
jgi:mono/diheme cytochrome c family protein